MGVYIPKMEIPIACTFCPMSHFNAIGDITGCDVVKGKKYVDVTDADFFENKKPSWCPLVEVPPHGDLIDKEWLFSFISTNNSLGATHYGCLTKEEIQLAPTVIEREE